MKKAIVLLSGGLDSATVIHIAKNQGFEIYALSFLYGQRHNIEIDFAKKIAIKSNVKEHKFVNIDLGAFGHSALTDQSLEVPKNQDVENSKEVPITYVPARNTIFLSFALAYGEVIGAVDIFIGANAVDYSNYPDCRPEFISAFEDLANKATAIKEKFKIHTPLINLKKSEIIKTGIALGVDYSIAHSCYDPINNGSKIFACGKCDSCLLRLKGFKDNNINDPYPYE